MKISPESLIADEGLCFNYKSFFISGGDEGYIFSIIEILISKFSKSGFVKQDLFDSRLACPDLFGVEKNYIYVCDQYVGDASVKEIENRGDIFIFYKKNSPKTRPIKDFFSKSKERALIECYELDQIKKKVVLSSFAKKHGLSFENDVFWFLIDILDNRFSILNKELDKVLLLNDKNNTLDLLNSLNPAQSIEANKLFFKLRLKSGDIVTYLNSSVNSLSDFYAYFSYFKIYSLLLISSKNKHELERSIPKYLFKERQKFINLYTSLNNNKKKLISSLLYKTENLIRKNPELYKALFFRFVLNYKKVIS